MLARLALLVAPLLLGCAPFTHEATLEASSQRVTFVGGRLNGSPVDETTFEAEGTTFKVESSVFVYEVAEPFQGLQFVASVAPMDPRAAWQPDEADMAALILELQADAKRRLEGLACDEPKLESTKATYQSECSTRRGGVDYRVRFGSSRSPRGATVLVASWTSPKSKLLVEQFWSSLAASSPSPASDLKASSSSAPSKVIATRISAAAFNAVPNPTAAAR